MRSMASAYCSPSAEAAVGQPLMESMGVHKVLIAFAHQSVQIVCGVLPPELSKHELLVARLDGHHFTMLEFHGVAHHELVEAVDARGVLHGSDLCRRGLGGSGGLGSGSAPLGRALPRAARALPRAARAARALGQAPRRTCFLFLEAHISLSIV